MKSFILLENALHVGVLSASPLSFLVSPAIRALSPSAAVVLGVTAIPSSAVLVSAPPSMSSVVILAGVALDGRRPRPCQCEHTPMPMQSMTLPAVHVPFATSDRDVGFDQCRPSSSITLIRSGSFPLSLSLSPHLHSFFLFRSLPRTSHKCHHRFSTD